MNINFGTKAETLQKLESKLSSATIPRLKIFTFEHWERDSDGVYDKIRNTFPEQLLALRSSALSEDGFKDSNAGTFISVLNINVDNKAKFKSAVSSIFSSYKKHFKNIKLADQVFVQPMIKDVDTSGVLFTHCVDDGSPYYVFSYDDETGLTDTVTSGSRITKTIYLHRDVQDHHCESSRLKKMLQLVRELEQIFPKIPLDIEFALDKKGVMYLLQVRPITTYSEWRLDIGSEVSNSLKSAEKFLYHFQSRGNGLAGDKTILANMPDWNPAELIGQRPKPLNVSIFSKLISSEVWHAARAALGYQKIPPTDLIVLVLGHVYVDTRASFNSFLPNGLSSEISEKLINCWLTILEKNPQAHDKVEFEVATTCWHFDFKSETKIKYDKVLSESELQDFEFSLLDLTVKLLDLSDQGSLFTAENAIKVLEEYQFKDLKRQDSPKQRLSYIRSLLNDCSKFGTFHFAQLARHAFVAETILRSLISRGALSEERVGELKSGISTITSEFSDDLIRVFEEKMPKYSFLQKYGHLRPSSFDITSPNYNGRPELFQSKMNTKISRQVKNKFKLEQSEKFAIEKIISGSLLNDHISVGEILDYVDRAIRAREYSKFLFSKLLSHILEELAEWGNTFGFSRSELAQLKLDEIMDQQCNVSDAGLFDNFLTYIKARRQNTEIFNAVRLSYMLRNPKDIYVVTVHRSEPTYVTRKTVDGSISFLNATSTASPALKGTIVCIESADPGFDWIFTQSILGLITKYGGSNSHMAIRCAELSIPAAIGCGEQIFSDILQNSFVKLDCSSKKIEIY